MGLLFRLIAHLLLTLARLAGPGGVRAVAAESLAVKHQLLIMKRSRRRGPNLTGWDRLILGFFVPSWCHRDAWARSPWSFRPRRFCAFTELW